MGRGNRGPGCCGCCSCTKVLANFVQDIYEADEVEQFEEDFTVSGTITHRPPPLSSIFAPDSSAISNKTLALQDHFGKFYGGEHNFFAANDKISCYVAYEDTNNHIRIDYVFDSQLVDTLEVFEVISGTATSVAGPIPVSLNDVAAPHVALQYDGTYHFLRYGTDASTALNHFISNASSFNGKKIGAEVPLANVTDKAMEFIQGGCRLTNRNGNEDACVPVGQRLYAWPKPRAGGASISEKKGEFTLIGDTSNWTSLAGTEWMDARESTGTALWGYQYTGHGGTTFVYKGKVQLGSTSKGGAHFNPDIVAPNKFRVVFDSDATIDNYYALEFEVTYGRIPYSAGVPQQNTVTLDVRLLNRTSGADVTIDTTQMFSQTEDLNANYAGWWGGEFEFVIDQSSSTLTAAVRATSGPIGDIELTGSATPKNHQRFGYELHLMHDVDWFDGSSTTTETDDGGAYLSQFEIYFRDGDRPSDNLDSTYYNYGAANTYEGFTATW